MHINLNLNHIVDNNLHEEMCYRNNNIMLISIYIYIYYYS